MMVSMLPYQFEPHSDSEKEDHAEALQARILQDVSEW